MEIFSEGVEIFSVGWKNFERVEKLSRGIEKCQGVEKYSGGLKNFQGRLQFFCGWGVDIFSRWVRDFSGGVEI